MDTFRQRSPKTKTAKPKRLFHPLLWRKRSSPCAVIEAELTEISAIQEDTLKLERIVAWSAAHPHEIPLALRFFVGNAKGIEDWVQRHDKAT